MNENSEKLIVLNLYIGIVTIHIYGGMVRFRVGMVSGKGWEYWAGLVKRDRTI